MKTKEDQMEFEQACQELDIPSDRVRLVKRNVELKAKLNTAIHSLEVIQGAYHDAYKHPGDSAECRGAVCDGVTKIVAMLRAD